MRAGSCFDGPLLPNDQGTTALAQAAMQRPALTASGQSQPPCITRQQQQHMPPRIACSPTAACRTPLAGSPPAGNLHRLVPHNLLQDVARLVLLRNVCRAAGNRTGVCEAMLQKKSSTGVRQRAAASAPRQRLQDSQQRAGSQSRSTVQHARDTHHSRGSRVSTQANACACTAAPAVGPPTPAQLQYNKTNSCKRTVAAHRPAGP